MSFETNLSDITLILDLFKQEEYLFFSSICYFNTQDDLYNKNVNLFGYNDDLNKINKNFDLGETSYTLPIGSSLIEFLNFNFDEFKDYFIYFTKYFGKYYDELTIDQFHEIESTPSYSSDKVVSLAKRIYRTDMSKVKKTQKIFRNAVEFIYNVHDREDLKPLNFQQRFYLTSIFNKNFFRLAIDLDNQPGFTFKYPSDFYSTKPKTEKQYIDRIMEYDPHGKKLTNDNYYKSKNIFSALYITLYHLTFITNTYIKKCKNCGKYFLSNKNNTVYCDNIFEDNKTCKQVGSRRAQKKKEDGNPVYQKYRGIYAKKAMNAKRNSDIDSVQEQYEKWKKETSKFLDDSEQGTKTYEQFDEWLEKNK